MELYIHLPFCVQKCRYCDFLSFPGCESLMPQYTDALLREAGTVAAALPDDTKIETVYLGGGTPSLLTPDLLQKLVSGLRQRFSFSDDAEFSSEANPGTLTDAWLETAKACGINRLSLGVQAFQDALLRLLGRIHTAADAAASVEMLQKHGFHDYNLDLMFGLPTQTEAQWHESLAFALALQPTHLSCYGLIPEEGTPLLRDLESGTLQLPEEETERRMYDDTLSCLSEHGFKQYEISNFAKPGHACRHNIGYWRQVPYIGLGLGASSMIRSTDSARFSVRKKNPGTFEKYFSMVSGNEQLREQEVISHREAMFETIMLGLRMTEGISASDFLRLHGASLASVYGDTLRSLAARGLLKEENGSWSLTRRGMDIQNAVLLEFMDEDAASR